MTKYGNLAKYIGIFGFMLATIIRQCNTDKKLQQQYERNTAQDELIRHNCEVNIRDSINLYRLQNNALELQRSNERINTLEQAQNVTQDEIQEYRAILYRMYKHLNTTNYADSSFQSLKDRLR